MKKTVLFACMIIAILCCFIIMPHTEKTVVAEHDVCELFCEVTDGVKVYKCRECDFSCVAEDSMPGFSPSGAEISQNDKISFSNDVIKVYTERWNIRALYYGTEERCGENDFAFALPGGGYDALVRLAVKPKYLDGVGAIMLKADLSSVRSQNAKLGVVFYTGSQNVACVVSGEIYAFDPCETEWKSRVSSSGIVSPSDGPTWLYIPLTSVKVSGSSATISSSTYISAIALSVSGASSESATKAVTSDFYLVSSGAAHVCSFVKKTEFEPTCVREGFELYNCEQCGTAKKSVTAPATGHTPGEYYKNGSGSFAICAKCGETTESDSPSNLTYQGDGVYFVTFDYGAAGGSKTLAVSAGHVLSDDEIPYKFVYEDRFIYQFNRWTSDADNIEPLDPVGYAVTGNVTFYAAYANSSYDNYRYDGLGACQAKGGGQYAPVKGKAVFMGNSNYALWYTLERDMAPEIDAINNSIDGSTTYDMVNFIDPLVVAYKPKICILNLSSNDNAYHHMTDKAILGNVKYMYERIRKYSPETVIVFMNANPLAGRTEFFEQIERVNAKAKALCDQWEMCEFIDVYDTVYALVSQYPTNWDTWTHFNAYAYSNIVGPQIKSQIISIMQKYGISF